MIPPWFEHCLPIRAFLPFFGPLFHQTDGTITLDVSSIVKNPSSIKISAKWLHYEPFHNHSICRANTGSQDFILQMSSLV